MESALIRNDVHPMLLNLSKVAVAEDGSMEVNSLNMNKLVQSDGDTLILDGGNAAV